MSRYLLIFISLIFAGCGEQAAPEVAEEAAPEAAEPALVSVPKYSAEDFFETTVEDGVNGFAEWFGTSRAEDGTIVMRGAVGAGAARQHLSLYKINDGVKTQVTPLVYTNVYDSQIWNWPVVRNGGQIVYKDGNQFIAGDHFSVADITAVVTVDFAVKLKLPILDEFEHLARWHGQIAQRPSYKA